MMVLVTFFDVERISLKGIDKYFGKFTNCHNPYRHMS